MVVGNPYEFAILMQNIPEWGDGFYRNGLFHFIVDGRMFPENLCTASLGVEFSEFDSSHALIALPENCEIFKLEKADAFKKMLCLAYPDYLVDYGKAEGDFDQAENMCPYKLSGQNAEEHGYYLFSVTCNGLVRVIGAKAAELIGEADGAKRWITILQPNVFETVIPIADVKNIIQQVVDYDLSTRVRKPVG